jgi:hypothetical protein
VGVQDIPQENKGRNVFAGVLVHRGVSRRVQPKSNAKR